MGFISSWDFVSFVVDEFGALNLRVPACTFPLLPTILEGYLQFPAKT
jgi:hypothetical protein